ncbi:MAG: hypothetical protein WD176_00220, partial [Pirellulales bacterium]
MLDEHYLVRNKHFAPPEPRHYVPEQPMYTAVFPLSRTLARFNDLHTANRITSANSVTLYRDDLFGQEFAASFFVSEPVHNLVHRQVMSRRGATFTSRRPDDERDREFLASSDNWFRPTSLRIGPDGALWIADMYRAVIEHPEWIPDEWEKRLDLRAGHDKGRFYRVRPVGVPPRPIPRLDKLDTAGLVAALDSPNGWQRDLVQRMLLWRKDAAAVPLLEKAASTGAVSPLARLHAICTLDGLGALRPEVLAPRFDDSYPGVRRHAVRLAESLVAKSPLLADKLLEAAAVEGHPQIQLQTAYSLGQWNDPRAGRALGTLAVLVAEDEYLTAAVLSSVNRQNIEQVLAGAFAERQGKPVANRLVGQLLRLSAALGADEALAGVLATVTQPAGNEYQPWQMTALAGVLDELARRGIAPQQLRTKSPDKLKQTTDSIQAMILAARRWVESAEADDDRRAAAIGLLGREAEHRARDIAALASLLGPQSGDHLQRAALERLARLEDDAAARALLAGWKTYSPRLRGQVLDALL